MSVFEPAAPKGKNIRLLSRLDMKDTRLVKGMRLEGLRPLGKAETFVRHYAEAGIDEIVFIDLVASLYARSQLYETISRISNDIFIPLSVVGGLRTNEDIRTALRFGADKVGINSSALHTPSFIDDAVKKYGSSTIVLSLEAKRSRKGVWTAFFHSGRENSGRPILEWIMEAQERGVGEVFLTDVNRDGTNSGFDLELLEQVSSVCSVPLIVSGGGKDPDDCVAAARYADAIALGSILHNAVELEEAPELGGGHFRPNTRRYGKQQPAFSIAKIKHALDNAGYDVRS